MNKYRTIMAALAVVLAAPPALAGEPVDRRLDASADTLIRVSNVKGEIRIEGWSRDELHLTGEIGEGSRDLQVDQAGNRIRIKVEIPRNARAVEDSILFLRVPAGASIEAEGVSAEIEIEGLSGRSILAHTVSSDISVAATVDSIDLKTVSGDIDFEGRAERSRLNSVSGDMDIVGVAGELSVTTVSGEVLMEAVELDRARFESVSGDIELAGALTSAGDLVIESLSGDVDLSLPDSLSARCEVESFSGSIKSDRGEVRKARHGPQQTLEFSAGDGAGRIRIESFSGDVRIRSRG